MFQALSQRLKHKPQGTEGFEHIEQPTHSLESQCVCDRSVQVSSDQIMYAHLALWWSEFRATGGKGGDKRTACSNFPRTRSNTMSLLVSKEIGSFPKLQGLATVTWAWYMLQKTSWVLNISLPRKQKQVDGTDMCTQLWIIFRVDCSADCVHKF